MIYPEAPKWRGCWEVYWHEVEKWKAEITAIKDYSVWKSKFYDTPIWRKTSKRYKKPNCERCDSSNRLNLHHKDRVLFNLNKCNFETLCWLCHMEEHKGDLWT